MGSDGLFDNLYEDDLKICVKNTDANPHNIATCLANKAHTMSYDKTYDSPFAKNAREAGKNHPGGKKDDITVVVSIVRLSN